MLGTGEGECSFKAFWRHADDRVGHGVQRQGLANFIGIRPELVGPKAVANDRDVVAAQLGVLAGKKKASGRRLEPQDVEIIRADHRAIDLPGLRAAAPRQWNRNDGSDAGEHFILLLIILEIAKRQTEFRRVGEPDMGLCVNRVQLNEVRNVLDRERMQQNRIDYGENGGVRADP